MDISIYKDEDQLKELERKKKQQEREKVKQDKKKEKVRKGGKGAKPKVLPRL